MARLKRTTKIVLRQAEKRRGLTPDVRMKFAKKIRKRRELQPGLFGRKAK